MDNKAVLYVGGGAMAGVFGAGVVTKLQEENAYDKFSHAYGASSGAWNIAYWLSKNTMEGSSIYWEDLTQGFINFSNVLERIVNPTNSPNVVDINKLVEVAKHSKILNIEEIKKSSIEAKVKVYNLKRNKIEYLNLKDDTIQRLKETASVTPWFYEVGQINIDAEIFDPLGYTFIRQSHPDKKLIFIINYDPKINLSRRTRNSLSLARCNFYN